MTISRHRKSRDVARRCRYFAILVAILAGAPIGCTREFFREWANMDVSEAVFEKSRDPRWRLDLFSIEPPMLSRFAQPYDQDVPPAPPDDPATEALSPVPQWADNRLMMPVEGTGYLDLLEYWRRDQKAKAYAAGQVAGLGFLVGLPAGPFPASEPEYWQRPDNGRHNVTDPRQPGGPGQPLDSPAGPPVPPELGSPFTPSPAPPPVNPRGGAAAPPGPGASYRQPSSVGDPRTAGLIVRLQDAGPGDSPGAAQGATRGRIRVRRRFQGRRRVVRRPYLYRPGSVRRRDASFRLRGRVPVSRRPPAPGGRKP